MSSESGSILIPVESPAEQEEHQKISRKLLKEVQNVSTMNKENVGKSSKLQAFLVKKELIKKTLLVDPLDVIEQKRKKLVNSQSCQTSPDKKVTGGKPKVTEEDLTSLEGPSEAYWQILAERRRQALEESLAENLELHEKISSLEEELNLSREMLEEARNLVEVLTEMLQEGEAEKQEGSKADPNQVDDSGVVPEVTSEEEDNL
ncbi:geminin-like isoform X2 [Malaya genurostris]|uniref:geminin-like isoform X2 n=1 Tax=Malaya genurostris TaxID=325434 RepID=UPI0026F3C104|nr:geminin-like isoform X2 [Malaya genurostris]